MNASAGWLLFALAGGMALAVQAGLNGGLGRLLGHPLWATLASLTVSVATVVPVMLLLRLKLPEAADAARAPWWQWLGGVLGALYVTAALAATPRLGVTTAVAAVITGQLMMSLVLDHFGLLGLARQPIDLSRIAGVVLLVAGLFLIRGWR